MAVLTILGATGYTGRLCAHEAVRAGLQVRLAGRRREALEALASRTGADAVTVADTADERSLVALAESSDVLLSTVGPYAVLGKPVVEAALRGGCHYLDVTGEVEFLRWVYAHDALARGAGLTFLPGVGFDGVPGDLLAALAAERLDGRVLEARVAYAMRNVRPSRGTARTMLGALQTTSRQPLWQAPFPPPVGRRPALPAPMPEVVTLERSTGATVTQAYLASRLAPLAAPLAAPAGAALRALATTPAWSLVQRAVDLLPEGASAESRARSEALVVAEVRSATGSATAWARLRDIYGVTATIAVAYAQRLLAGDLPRGVLTPSQAAPAETIFKAAGAEWGV